MKQHLLTTAQIDQFSEALRREERSAGTVAKYLRDLTGFVQWLDGRLVSVQTAAEWKHHLLSSGLMAVTVNSKLSALNSFLRFLGWEECKVKYLKLQRRVFRSQDRELVQEEYHRLWQAARSLGRERLALLLETICSTGIRVSEVRYITVESAKAGRADVSLKGKIRTLLLPNKLCRKLLNYAKKQKNTSGEIFITRSGKSLSRRQIWQEMKRLCKHAKVEPSKVFPHNLRHLFATVFYRTYQDVVRLADILGHSSINTTRIYLQTAGAEHAWQLEQLRLIT